MSNAPIASNLKVHTEGKTLRIEFAQLIDSKTAEQFSIQSKSWLLSGVEALVFDFQQVKEIKAQAYRAFVTFHQLISKTEIRHASVHVGTNIAQQMKADGLQAVFNPITEKASDKVTTKKSPFDVVLINAFCSATKKTLEVQAGMQVTVQKPQLVRLDEKNPISSIGIVGIMNLATDHFCGSLTLMFSAEVFLKIYERMIGETHTEISHEIEDAAGEILNIIYGTAKTELNQQPGYNLKPILPTVLSGGKLNVRQRTSQMIIQLPFETDLGTFYIEVAVEKSAEKSAA